MFFSFDGIDGVGKSTQLTLFCKWLDELGSPYLVCRDPGSTALGEAIRDILLDGSGRVPIGRRSEMLLYMAARAQLVEEVIAPALATGKIVISDRFLLANVVYQGHAGGLDVPTLWEIGHFATAGVEPDLVFLLDMPVAQAAARLNRPLDRMEQQGDQFMLRLRDGFLAEARRSPRVAVVDAAQPIEAVQNAIRTAAAEQLKRA